MTTTLVCACLLSALSIVEMETLSVEGRVGKDVTFKCSNWNAWTNVRDNVKYLCLSPCTEDKHVIIKADLKKTASNDRIWITNTAEGLFVTFKNLKTSDSKKYYCGVERSGRDTLIEVNLKVLPELPVPKTSAKPVTVGSTVSSAVSSSNLDITTDMLVSYSTIYVTPTASAVVPAEATYFLIVLAATVTTVIILLVIMKTVKRQKIETSADSPPEDPQESGGPDGVYEKLHPSTIDGDQVYSTLKHTMRGCGGLLEPIPAVIEREVGVHHGQVASPSQGQHRETDNHPNPHTHLWPI